MTQYTPDALRAALRQVTRLGLPTGDAFVCPVDPDVRMPMIFVDDLMRGLISIQEADASVLVEPQVSESGCPRSLSRSFHTNHRALAMHVWRVAFSVVF